MRSSRRATDAEGRTAHYPARIVVAEKLAITTALFRPAKVGEPYGVKLKTFGGVKPTSWRITAGQLPRGVRFTRSLGVLAGTPKKSGGYRLTFEAMHLLGVVSKKTLRSSSLGSRDRSSALTDVEDRCVAPCELAEARV